MDNVCHTLVGAALAESGLGRRTSLGFATLLIGANLPDLDVLSYFDGPLAALEWRRGWSHGAIALAVLPFLLTATMVALDRLSRRLRRAVMPSEVRVGQVLLLAFIAIATHPVLDTLNTYGMRWTIPWRPDWTYGDTLFIVDPWVWIALAMGVWISRKRRHARVRNIVPEAPARRALALCAAYVILMAVSGVAARRVAARELGDSGGAPVRILMAGPVAFNPFAREIVAAQGDDYRTARFQWLGDPHLDPASLRAYPATAPSHPAIAAATATTAARRFLGWARFPTFTIDSSGPAWLVHIVDIRYATRPGAGFGSLSVEVGR